MVYTADNFEIGGGWYLDFDILVCFNSGEETSWEKQSTDTISALASPFGVCSVLSHSTKAVAALLLLA